MKVFTNEPNKIQNIWRNKIINDPRSYNDNSQAPGRFANHFIRDLASSFIAKNNNIKFFYGQYKDKIQKLGINLFEGGERYNQNIILDDNTFFKYINSGEKLEKNFSLFSSYCQSKEFANYVFNYLNEKENKDNIIKNNIYNERYNNNNDVFIHIRLGDVLRIQEGNHTFEYFDNILKNLEFDKGYISSDSINHNICQRLIQKYSLEIFNKGEVETIMFGSTCKNVILSAGTFSWMIGVFSFYSNVYYKLCKNKWSLGYSNEIFDIPSWIKIST